jgi:hypothetical protein
LGRGATRRGFRRRRRPGRSAGSTEGACRTAGDFAGADRAASVVFISPSPRRGRCGSGGLDRRGIGEARRGGQGLSQWSHLKRRRPSPRHASSTMCWPDSNAATIGSSDLANAEDSEEFAVAADAFRHAPTEVSMEIVRRARPRQFAAEPASRLPALTTPLSSPSGESSPKITDVDRAPTHHSVNCIRYRVVRVLTPHACG